MIVRVDGRFEKDTDKISIKNLSEKIAQTIEEVRKCNYPREIRNLKKMGGGNHYYRIRLGDYRIGITIIGDTVTFIRFLNRKDIYKYFP